MLLYHLHILKEKANHEPNPSEMSDASQFAFVGTQICIEEMESSSKRVVSDTEGSVCTRQEENAIIFLIRNRFWRDWDFPLFYLLEMDTGHRKFNRTAACFELQEKL